MDLPPDFPVVSSPRPPTKASTAQIESYITICMGLSGKTRDEVIKGAVEMCGSLDVAALAVGAEIERGTADLMQAFPGGVENSNSVIGVSCHLHPIHDPVG